MPVDPRPFLSDLAAALAGLARPETRAWWERYLKGEARFRGVPMAGVRSTVRELWDRHGLATHDADEIVTLALACIDRTSTEDKLAGILLLAEHVPEHLGAAHLARLEAPFRSGAIADWNVCDWYCVKVLGPLVGRAPDTEVPARELAAWRSAGPMWQRRAAAVAFVDLADRGDDLFPGFVDLLFTICDANAADPARWMQTSVGWLLRELSGAEPGRVRSWVEANAGRLSSEARRTAVARL